MMKTLRQLSAMTKVGANRLIGRKAPVHAVLSLTNRCNFRCRYCEIPEHHREEMTTEEWCAGIDELCGAGMLYATVLGGEPLLREDCGAIARHLERAGVFATLDTNGWLVADRMDVLQHVNLVSMSFDGPPEIHDRQRHPGSHARVVEGLELLRRRGKTCIANCVVTSTDVTHLEHVLQVCRELGTQAFFQLEHDRAADVRAPIAAHLTSEDIASIASRLLELKRRGWPVGNSEAILARQMSSRYLGDCASCFCGRYSSYILCDGTISPCLFTAHQQQPANARKIGFLKAFYELPPPRGPGCSCGSIHELNHILSLDGRALARAIRLRIAA